MKDFDNIDDFDEFESVDLSGSSGRTVRRGYSNMGSAAGTSGGAASRITGTGSHANSSTGSQYANGSRSGSYVNSNGTGAYTNNNGSGSYAASGASGTSGNMHDLFNDPTFDPTRDDEFDDFPEDFDMHGDPVYTNQTEPYAWRTDAGYGNAGYSDTGRTDGDFSDDFDDFEEDFDMHGDVGYDEPEPQKNVRESHRNTKKRSSTRRDESKSGKSRNSDNTATKRVSSLTRRIIAFAIAEVLVLTGIFSYAFIKRQYNKIQRPDIDIDAVTNPNLSIEDIQKMDEGFWTVAIFGLDSRDSSAGKGNNSDVIIVATINRETGEIKLVSVFRDTYLSLGDGTYNKINAAYCNGGPEQAIKALNENLDLNITQYATFNWKAVATAINMLGGVDVEISKAEFYYINSFITETVQGTGIASVHLKQAGMNHLDGVQAVAYARLRYMDNDYARTERQRKIIGLCFEKVKKTDPSTLLNMAGVMLEMVATNMGWQEASDAVGMLSRLYMGDTGGFPYARGEAVIGKRGSCVIPQTLESNVIELHRQLFGEENYQCSEKVKSIGAKISAESGMYTEGTFIGHVSTQGYIPETKAAQTAAAETTAAETSASETVESRADDSWDVASMTDEELQEKIEEYLKDLGITADDREYAVSTDGYIVYVAGQDADGLPTYKYVLGNDGKRIRVIETSQETTAEQSSSSAESSSGAETTAVTKPTAPGGTTEASGPGATKPSANETSATETRAASTETIEAQTTEAVTPGTTTSHSTTTSGNSTSSTTGGSSTSGSSTNGTVKPGSSTSGSSSTGTVTPGGTTQTTAVYPGSNTTSESDGGPGSSTTTTTAASAPGSSSSSTSTTGTVTPGSTSTTTAASAPGGSSTETVPAAP